MITLLREGDRGWMAEAACRGHDASLWYPITVPSALALAICAGCPVRQRCADYAEDMRDQHGVWGGLTVEQRKRRAWQRQEAGRG